MKKIFALGVLTVLVSALLCGCGNSGKTVLNVYNANDYIADGIIEEFEAKYPDVKVNYEMFDSNESMYSKIKNSKTQFDVIFPSDYMIERMIEEDMLEKIDFNNVPNFANIADEFKNLSYDPLNEYSVPYMWGTVGILYNKTMVDGDVTWETLWDEKYAGKVLMYDSTRDTIGVTLKMLGYSLNSTNADELNQAKEKLIEQRDIVLAYVLDEVRDKMVSGEAALAVVYSGDASLCIEENEDLVYVVPDKGSNMFYDCMCIPKNSPNKELAENFINFILDSEIEKKNAELGYLSPHTDVYNNEEFRSQYAEYPTEEALKNCEIFSNLGTEANALYSRIWTEIKAAL